GIGVLTERRVGLGMPMPDCIISPVKQQLAEFHQRKVNKMLKELENDPVLRVANRPRYFRISIPRGALEESHKAALLADLPPADGRPLSFADLTARAQFQTNAAGEALQQKKWTALKTTAVNLAATAQRFEAATSVPEEVQASLDDWARRLANEAASLADFADGEKQDKAEDSLARIQELMGDKGMDTTVARIDDRL